MVRDVFALKVYARVARLNSFSAAAREFRLSQPQVSRLIADLETELGTRLLSRTTRAVVPTEAGSLFLERVTPILMALEEAEDSVREGDDLRGTVRLSMPTSLGTRTVIPYLAALSEAHPRLHVQLLLDDRRQDLVRDAVDVAIRLGHPSGSAATATARVIGEVPRVTIASPRYLACHGRPAHPQDLTAHRIVGGPATSVPTAWMYAKDGTEEAPDLRPHFSTDENEGTVAAATAGVGITSTGYWACLREVNAGELEVLLPEWKMRPIPAYAYFPMGAATRATARAVVEHLIASLRADPAIRATLGQPRP